jgi:hypothetical protein
MRGIWCKGTWTLNFIVSFLGVTKGVGYWQGIRRLWKGIGILKELEGTLKAWAVGNGTEDGILSRGITIQGLIPWEQNCSILTIATIIQIYDTTISCSKRLLVLVLIIV